MGTPVVNHGLVYFPSRGVLYAVDAGAKEIRGSPVEADVGPVLAVAGAGDASSFQPARRSLARCSWWVFSGA